MKTLLDTCVLLWLAQDSKELSPRARALLSKEESLGISSISFWEISIKIQTKKLKLGITQAQFLEGLSNEFPVEEWPLTIEDTFQLNKLPLLHKDPFDRALVAQAIYRGAQILTPDHLIQQYPLMTIW